MIKVESVSKKEKCYLCGDPILNSDPAKIQIKSDNEGIEEHKICNVCETICSEISKRNEDNLKEDE